MRGKGYRYAVRFCLGGFALVQFGSVEEKNQKRQDNTEKTKQERTLIVRERNLRRR